MTYRPRRGKFEKLHKSGQFFIISTIIVAFSLVGIQFLLAGYNLADPSKIFALQEDYLFFNTKAALNQTYYAYPCPLMERNLNEVKNGLERKLQTRLMILNVTFTDPCAGAGENTKQTTTFYVNLTSRTYVLYDEFTLAP